MSSTAQGTGPRGPLRILVAAAGSAGDTYPMAALAVALRERGHDPALVTRQRYEMLARKLDLECIPLDRTDEFDLAGVKHSFRQPAEHFVIRCLRPIYEIIQREQIVNRTILVGSVNTFGTRLAREKLGIPLANVHVQPAVIHSVYDAPGLPLPEFPGLPKQLARLMRRTQFSAAARWKWAGRCERPLNEFRSELGLDAVRSPFYRWIHSPDLNIGLFPNWFAEPQPDWPSNTQLTGFPLFNTDPFSGSDPAVEVFLDSGEPPIVFTLGSEYRFGHRFFRTATEVCRLLGSRGILLTRFPEQLPASLPAEVRHFEWVPLGRLLLRARAVVHHGGIGTGTLALAAGIPQIVVPRAHDQPDNAARLKRLGVAEVLPAWMCTPRRLRRGIERLLGSEQVARNCRHWAQKVHETDPLPVACRLIEELAKPAP